MSRYQRDLRFQKIYGLPKGRNNVAINSLEHQYKVEKELDPGKVGGLNEGIFLVRKFQDKKLRVQKRIPVNAHELEREILILQVLRHPNIVSFHDAFITTTIPRKAGLYLEYCDGGSLGDLITRYCKKNKEETSSSLEYVPEAFAWHVVHSLASALQYLHHGIRSRDHSDPPVPMNSKDWPVILHRDIKPDNIFLHHVPQQNGIKNQPLLYPHWPFNQKNPNHSMTTYPKIVLGDFGVATQHDEPDFPDITHFNGTLRWMPPELPEATARGDVWVTGAVILSLCRLLPDGPLPPPRDGHPDPMQWLKSAEARKGIRDMGLGASYSPELTGLLRDCLRYNRFNRPFSYDLMAGVRKGEEAVIGSGRVPIKPLPRWAF